MAKKKTKKKEFHCVVKHRTGICEEYDERKVYKSVYAACHIVHMGKGECKKVASDVAGKITKLIRAKKELNAKEIGKQATKELRKHNKNAAFMYETHRDIS